MGLMPWEKTTSCPYDPSHQITVSRIQTHLIKCRRNHPTTDHVICPYNSSHHIPKPEEKFHMANCCDRKFVELAKYSWQLETPGCHGNFDPPPAAPLPQSLNPQDFQDDLEDWVESGKKIGSYDPEKYCEKMDVLRRLKGATRSERRKFNAAEKIRHEGLLSLDESRPSFMSQCEEEAGDFHSPRPSLFREELPSQPLRRPTIVEDKRESQKKQLSREVEEKQTASASGSGRHGSITTRLLSMVGSKRRQGIKTQDTSLDTTMDTTMDNLGVNDTLDSTLGRMALSGRLAELSLQDSAGQIRRPAGVGKGVGSSK